MRYSVLPNKEKGVVLILVLAFLTMFAIMVSAFLIVTSNMSDSAVNSLALYEKGETPETRAESDIDTGIKTLLTGTYNVSSPIGPFGILENLYGDQTTAEGADLLALQYYNLTAEYDANGIPQNGTVTIYLQSESAKFYGTDGTLVKWYEQRIAQLQERLDSGTADAASISKTIEKLQYEHDLQQNMMPEQFRECRLQFADQLINCGNILSFGRLQWLNSPEVSDGGYIESCIYFNEHISGTTARIYDRSLVKDDDGVPYLAVFKIALSEELKDFFTRYPITAYDADGNENLWPLSSYSQPNFYNLSANLRLNSKQFGGTGAGGFDAKNNLDGQLTYDEALALLYPEEAEEGAEIPLPANSFRLPFAYWGNASAPDLTPYLDLNGNVSFRTFWRHLSNGEYNLYTPNSGAISPAYNGIWSFSSESDVTPQPTVRMNPGYTAPDMRSLFLGQINQNGQVLPSFLRTDSLSEFCNEFSKLSAKGNSQSWLSILRKMTPRPLKADHWKWTGGNTVLSPEMTAEDGSQYTGSRQEENYLVYQIASAMLNRNIEYLNPWDVDNDNDGVKDGIWIPSGLPIRTDENGTPYATMYSFTVLDMDGRVNLNTAGNWNQLPCPGSNAYSSLEELTTLYNQAVDGGSPAVDSPWFNTEKLEGGIGWMDDKDEAVSSLSGQRGTGLGPAGIDLTAVFEYLKLGTGRAGEIAAQTIARRYHSDLFNLIPSALERSDYSLFDGQAYDWTQVTFRGELEQPSAYTGTAHSGDTGTYWSWDSGQNPDDSDSHRRFFLHTDPIYKGDKGQPSADPNLFVFPWRGKTRVADYGNPGSPKNCLSYPTFDFCDTALRTYDPLGNDILTYMPQYSENPYLVDPYASTHKDSTFTAEMLEALLRPYDYDRKARDRSLINTLMGGDLGVNLPPIMAEMLRKNLTTISSDIPVPAEAIPVGITEVQDGVFGIRELIRRCVLIEIYKANQETLFDEGFVSGLTGEFVNETGMTFDTDEGKSAFRRYVRKRIEEKIAAFNSGALDMITDQLFALLPKDIQEGRRLDLNELSHKACWLDTVYKEQGDGTFVRTDLDDQEKADQHALGLVERMKYARGLYVLLMTLTYEDRNAKAVSLFYDSDPDNPLTEEDQYQNYLEGYDSKFIESLKADEKGSETQDEKKARYTEELIANRIAQYCVNLIDFTDPDATMTPFFYDPNPFDGWWSYRDPSADWMNGDYNAPAEGEAPPAYQGNNDLFFVLFTPTIDSDDPERDFYDGLLPERDDDGIFIGTGSYFTTPDASVDGTQFKLCVNQHITSGAGGQVSFVADGDTYAQAIVAWLNGQSVEHTKISEDDFGFRVVWGMERPDLVLTETLNFHDLGIADTKYEKANGQGALVAGDDSDYDQVRRPLGSTYLELYCAANPNIPQSPELYKFDEDRNVWKLELSKMTPRQGGDSPYSGKEFPVWRMAITASSDPRSNEEKDKEFTDTIKNGEETSQISYKRTIRKKGNSVVERLLGDDADWRTFSFRTRQFCDLTQEESGEKSLDTSLDSKWRGYDYCVANILGPCAEGGTKSGDSDFSDEVEIDRLVWFGWPTLGGSFDKIDSYPDARHIFSRVKETTGDDLETFIYPNQYLVVAPAEKRGIGSKLKDKSYFGVPSKRKLVMTKLREEKSGEYTNSDYILAGTYFGIDINSDDSFEVNKRGLNISEPLWNNANDPYKTSTIPTKDIKEDGEDITVTDLDSRQPVPDHPFDIPVTDHKKDNFPIAADHLLGVGIVPGYRSAFVQRVADPNRPYHPCVNPYISVDWNMMDLAVFTGEANDIAYSQSITSDSRFYESSNEGGDDNKEIDEKNRILLSKSAFVSDADAYLDFEPYKSNTTSLFSSRRWLNVKEKGFFPKDLQDDIRPNLWARALDKEEVQKDKKAGLEPVVSVSEAYKDLTDIYDEFTAVTGESDLDEENVIKIFPRHSLGAYNNPKRRVTDIDSQFSGTFDSANLRKLYYGSPSISDTSDTEFQPFEYLPWNDAPFSSPAELLLVPASAPGRFGLEFVRNKEMQDASNGDGLSLEVLSQDAESGEKKLGRSLGSDGGTGKALFGWKIDSSQTSPYLNFHHSSSTKGESLNLSSLFDFVTVPSLYNGTKQFCGYDENGDPLYVSKLREPGKININTIRESGWNGILSRQSRDDAAASGIEQTQTKYDSLQNRSVEVKERDDSAAGSSTLTYPFQSALSSRFFPDFPRVSSTESKREKAVEFKPADATLLTRREIGDGDDSVYDPLFDSGEKVKNNNLYTATDELRKFAGLTTNRSNVFAVWMTVGYFKVERARPGVNMPLYDPDGNSLLDSSITTRSQNNLQNDTDYLDLGSSDKYYDYYRAIYPDGYTYGKELGTEGIDEGGVNRPRAFFLIDRSIPVDFRRGRSWNWKDVILLERKL